MRPGAFFAVRLRGAFFAAEAGAGVALVSLEPRARGAAFLAGVDDFVGALAAVGSALPAAAPGAFETAFPGVFDTDFAGARFVAFAVALAGAGGASVAAVCADALPAARVGGLALVPRFAGAFLAAFAAVVVVSLVGAFFAGRATGASGTTSGSGLPRSALDTGAPVCGAPRRDSPCASASAPGWPTGDAGSGTSPGCTASAGTVSDSAVGAGWLSSRAGWHTAHAVNPRSTASSRETCSAPETLATNRQSGV